MVWEHSDEEKPIWRKIKHEGGMEACARIERLLGDADHEQRMVILRTIPGRVFEVAPGLLEPITRPIPEADIPF